ncbi:hypothetical protein Hanom_Chr13g01208941 [Helianthus anomalus]
MVVAAMILEDSAIRQPFEQESLKTASYKVGFGVFGFLFAAALVSRRRSCSFRQWRLGFR